MTSEPYKVMHHLIERGVRALDGATRDYLLGGAESETTVLRNRAAYDRRAFVPRVLRDVSEVRTEAAFLGQETQMPVFLSPVGALPRFHPDGAAGAAQAAGASGVPVFFSSLDPTPLHQMRAATSGSAIYQLYVRGDAAWVDQQLAQAAEAGFDALCLTVDSAVYGRRERDLATGAQKPYRKAFTPDAMRHQAALSWRDVARLAEANRLPLILKGIAAPEDARLAVENGAAAVYVSNHGGRQLDHTAATLDLLPAVAAEVAGQIPVYVDGGVLRGTDVLKALALGADAVGVGRLYCCALAAEGGAGVLRCLALLREELGTAMALLGARVLSDLEPSLVVDAPGPGCATHLFSAFPGMSLPSD